jgi:S-adenosylmethionine:tRNA ribosyltransferase-isomerase
VRLELFDYELPPERIAQTPIEPRDASRLLVLKRDGSREHRRFLDLPEYLNRGDLLVFNDTRVLPARLFGTKDTGARVEVLLLQRLEAGRWEGLVYPGRRLGVGAKIRFGDEELSAEVVDRGEEGTRVLAFSAPAGPQDADERIHRTGQMPLPPYIHERLDDPERYQTLYAREEGSAAAPTAGLHFTPRVFQALEERGVEFAYVTLHVGIATFRPVKTETVEEHQMHAEWYSVPVDTARKIAGCRGRVVAVGTTTVRCLESAALSEVEGRGGRGESPRVQHSPLSPLPSPLAANRAVRAGSGTTRMYITPGYHFRVVDALLTNFHMPKSSLLILVSAFAGIEPIRAAYQDALQHGYRFLSFGDAMFLEARGGADYSVLE